MAIVTSTTMSMAWFLGTSIIGGVHKAVFDKDFSSLGTELDLGRVSSPGLNMVVQSLLIGAGMW